MLCSVLAVEDGFSVVKNSSPNVIAGLVQVNSLEGTLECQIYSLK